MELNNEIQYLAKLAGLEISSENSVCFKKDLDELLCYVEQLEQYDVTNVEPMTYVHDVFNVKRLDEVTTSLQPDEVFHNCKHKQDNFFKVPTILRNK